MWSGRRESDPRCQFGRPPTPATTATTCNDSISAGYSGRRWPLPFTPFRVTRGVTARECGLREVAAARRGPRLGNLLHSQRLGGGVAIAPPTSTALRPVNEPFSVATDHEPQVQRLARRGAAQHPAVDLDRGQPLPSCRVSRIGSSAATSIGWLIPAVGASAATTTASSVGETTGPPAEYALGGRTDRGQDHQAVAAVAGPCAARRRRSWPRRNRRPVRARARGR